MTAKNSTQEQVKRTADILLQEGIRPTQQNIRERMGSGSITTINKALNAWWKELGQRLKANVDHPSLPDPVAESAHKLWLQALAYADNTYKERRKHLEQEYIREKNALAHNKDNEIELKELRSQCLRLLQDNERVINDKYELQAKNAKLENELMAANSTINELSRELKQTSVVAGSHDVDALIDLQVENRTIKEECARLQKQLKALTSERTELQFALLRNEQDN